MSMKSELEKLSSIFFEIVYSTLRDIEDQRHISRKGLIKLGFHSNYSDHLFREHNAIKNRQDALTFLIKLEMLYGVEGYSSSFFGMQPTWRYFLLEHTIQMQVDWERFEEIKKEMEAICENRLNKGKPVPIRAPKGTIYLDNDIAICERNAKTKKKYFLLLGRNKEGEFIKDEPIAPQIYQIIKYFFYRRNKDNAKSPAELCDDGIVQNRSTASNRIAQIKRICEKNAIPPILVQFPDTKWGLNRDFDSCKNASLVN